MGFRRNPDKISTEEGLRLPFSHQRSAALLVLSVAEGGLVDEGNP